MEKNVSEKGLMIGDWVMLKTNKRNIPIKVEEILGVGINGIWDYQELRSYDSYLDLYHIPLTKEILTKNAFIRKEVDCVGKWLHYDKGELSPFVDFELEESRHDEFFCLGGAVNAKVKTVADLQHALRLCRLEEVAENIIV